MPTSSKSAVEPVQQPAVEKPLFAVCFQLEDVAVNGRKAAFDTLKKIFGRLKKDLTPALFARHGLGENPAAFLPAIADALEVQNADTDKLLEDYNGHVTETLAGLSPDPGFTKILDAAGKRKYARVAVTALPEMLAASICGRLGLDEMGVRLVPFQNGDRLFPGPTTWLKTARAVEVRPRCCLVITSVMQICKSALSADMQCMVVPDEFTEHQDFSGANMVLESFAEAGADKVLDMVFPAPRK